MNEIIKKVFDGRYIFIKKLGEGGMGEVYLVETNDRLKHQRAIKAFSINQTVGQDVLHEAFVLKALEHEGIPRIIEIKECIDIQYIFIVQEFIEGITLEAILEDNKKIKDKVVYEWGEQLAKIIQYIHGKKVLHRDIKLENIMLTSEGVIKLIDFGIAQKSNELVKQAYTPKYASPEQHKGGVLNESSDIYSLSMVLCHLLTGKLPILNENLDAYAFVPKLDADHYMSGLVTIIKKGLEISPRKRYQNSRALVKDFNRIHKLTKDYKRYVWRRDLAVGFTILLMVSGSILIYGGKEQLAYEAEVEYSALCQEANDLIYSNQDYDQAKLVLEEAQRIFEDRLSTYAIEAELLLHQKDYEAVLIHMNQLNTAFDLSRQDRLYYIWGTAYFELEDYENASFYIGLAYESAPYEEVYLRDYGVSSARNNDYVTSEKMITALKEGSYASDISFYVTAEYFMATNQYEEALDDFRRALDSSQDMEIIERCYLSMAKLYKSQQSILDPYAEKRVQVLEEAKEVLNRKDHRILMEQLGEAYFDYGRLSDDEDVKNQALNNALNTFNTLIELGNHQIHIYQNKLIIHQLLKDYQEVEKTIGEMLNLFPNQVSVQYQLVWHHLIVENDKEINERDYSKVLKAFNGIHNYSDVDYKQSDYIQLKGFMEELIINRWVDAADVKWN